MDPERDEVRKANAIANATVFAGVVSFALILIGSFIYFRWVFNTWEPSIYTSLDNAHHSILAVALVPAILFVGALKVARRDSHAEPIWSTMGAYAVFAALPLGLIIWAATYAHVYTGEPYAKEVFARYTKAFEKTAVRKPNVVSGAGPQLVLCGSEHDKNEVVIGQFCAEINTSNAVPRAVIGGYRVNDASFTDCFGTSRDLC